MISPTVTVLSANYNNGRFLPDYFESLLASPFPPHEIIIVDDASTDNSIEVIQQYSARYAQIRLIALQQNVGFANALNVGLASVSMRYTVRLDTDDIMVPDRLQRQIQFLEENRGYAIVGSNIGYFITDSSTLTRTSCLPLSNDGIRRAYMQGKHGLAHGGVCIRSEIYKKYRYRQECVPSEEYDIFSRMLQDNVSACNLPNVYTLVRIHSSSISHYTSFHSIKKLFELRYQIWGIGYTYPAMLKAYIVKRAYRKYLYTSKLNKIPYACILLLFSPLLSGKRLLNAIQERLAPAA